MPRKCFVVKTRADCKRRLHENHMNYTSKKMRVSMMKGLVLEYNKIKCKNKVDTNLFHNFYIEKKVLFPWLKKESLRWHVQKKEVKDTSSTTSDNSSTNPKSTKDTSGSLIINQSQIRT